MANNIASLDASAGKHHFPCGDVRMVWRSWGSGAPVLLLHGGAGSGLHWVRTNSALQAQFRLLVPDLPGMGGSDEPTAGSDLWDLARLLNLAAETATEGAAYHLIGFSFGAILAGHVAALFPAQVRSLTLIGSGGMGLPRPRTPMEKARNLSHEAEIAAHRRNLERLMFHDPACVDDEALSIQIANSRTTRLRHRDITAPDALRRVTANLDRPISVTYGEHDSVTVPFAANCVAHFAAVHPQSRTEIIPNAGHWVAYEAADAVNALLIECLQEG